MPRVTLASGTPAELALPTRHEPERGVVLAPDIMGLRPLFDELAQRLADEYRWAVIVVEPFPGRETMTLEERFSAVAGLEDERQLGDLVDAAGHVEGLAPGEDRVAVLGFCMGGMYALKAAGIGRFDRAVAFYGMIRLPEGWRGPGHGEPLDAISRPEAAPVLAIIGTEDNYTPPPDVDALEATGATVVRYEGAEHGFVHDPSRPSHRAEDAADAWRRVVGFLSYDNDEDSIDES